MRRSKGRGRKWAGKRSVGGLSTRANATLLALTVRSAHRRPNRWPTCSSESGPVANIGKHRNRAMKPRSRGVYCKLCQVEWTDRYYGLPYRSPYTEVNNTSPGTTLPSSSSDGHLWTHDAPGCGLLGGRGAHKAITLHLRRHAAPQLAHALRPHPHEGAGCDLGQWRRWGEATPAQGVLEAFFCILPRRCRPTLARVGLQGGGRAHQEQPVDGAQGCSASGCRGWAHGATGRRSVRGEFDPEQLSV